MKHLIENCLRKFPRNSVSPFSSIGQRTPWNLYLSRESVGSLPVETTEKTREKDLHLISQIEKSLRIGNPDLQIASHNFFKPPLFRIPKGFPSSVRSKLSNSRLNHSFECCCQLSFIFIDFKPESESLLLPYTDPSFQ